MLNALFVGDPFGGDLALAAAPLGEAHQPRVAKSEVERLEQRERRPADRVHQPQVARQAPSPAARDLWLGAREHPRGRGLEQVQASDLGLNLRHELDRRRARADDRYLAALELVLVVPARGVKDPAAEAVDAGELGDLRIREARRRPR